MPRPKTKAELLQLSQLNFDYLNSLVDSYSPKEQLAEFPKGTMNRNITDVLAHLHHWHLIMLDWYKVGMAGKKPDMPAKGYTWKTLPELNEKIWSEYDGVDLKTIRKELDASFKRIRALIDKHSNDELFEKKRYGWTGSTSLGSYLISVTSSHYDWAHKLIKKAKRVG